VTDRSGCGLTDLTILQAVAALSTGPEEAPSAKVLDEVERRIGLGPSYSRIVPTHPELTRLLRDHLVTFGTAPDGRLFGGVRGGELPTITYRRVWIKARQAALTTAEQVSPLARRPYDLRHACLSTWLNGGVYPTQMAEWAGHSVDVLLRIYARCVVGQDELAKRRISEALRQS
jgi:integrase